MNGRRDAASVLVEALRGELPPDGVETAVCPPYPHLAEVGARLGDGAIGLGAQDLSEHEAGAYTGEVSAAMLRDYNCRYVIVGHSERRTLFGETDAVAAAKMMAAVAGGIVPILCLGERAEERARGETEAVLAAQLGAAIARCDATGWRRTVIAYEPIWAIGTGRSAVPEQVQQVHRYLRDQLAAACGEVAQDVRILYGGSIRARNAAALFAMADVDGGLVGGASLDKDEFIAICRMAKRRTDT